MAPASTPKKDSTPVVVTLAAAHARLAQWALAVYVCAGIVLTSLLLVALFTEKTHQEDQQQAMLQAAAVDRSYTLRRYLDLLTAELTRLGSRTEIQSGDNDSAPERELLELAHKQSTLFDVGVAILDRDGAVVWSEPRAFLAAGTSFRDAPWFAGASGLHEPRIVPVTKGRADALLYVVTPAHHDGHQNGFVLGAVDLAQRSLSEKDERLAEAATLVTKLDGTVIYPATPPSFTRDSAYRRFFKQPLPAADSERLRFEGEPWVLAASHLPGTDLVYVMASSEASLFSTLRQRMALRVAIGLVLVVPPLWMLVLILQRAHRAFRQSEQEAVERERLQLLADASNLIAHEVRNALNGLKVGLDLLLQGDRSKDDTRQARIVRQLRDEMQRLAEFTGELMLFSKGIVPHPVRVDLADCVPKLSELSLDLASEAGCEIDVRVERAPVFARVDPALLRVVLGNLIGNALDVLASKAESPGRVRIVLDADATEARVRVVDDGPGVSPDFKSQLFEPFQTSKPSGTGLGLALSRRIARAHGGDLVLEESSAGASFLLTLPSEAP